MKLLLMIFSPNRQIKLKIKDVKFNLMKKQIKEYCFLKNSKFTDK